MGKGKPASISDSEFRSRTISFFRSKELVFPLPPRNLASLITDSGTHSRETSLALIDMFAIEVVENQDESDISWYANVDKLGNARIIYPKDKLLVKDLELDNLELEHEFGHLLYWGMMNYLGRLRVKPRNYFEENYAWTFARYLRIGNNDIAKNLDLCKDQTSKYFV